MSKKCYEVLSANDNSTLVGNKLSNELDAGFS